MHLVNEAFDLPNPPPSRLERTLKRVKEVVTGAVMRLPRSVKPEKQEPTRVSYEYQHHAVWARRIDLYVEINS